MTNSILIEAGATKTRIAFKISGEITVLNRGGLNGNLNSEADFFSFFKELGENIPFQVNGIYYYGAGMGSPTGKLKVEKGCSEIFNVNINIETDLLGACRACLGNENGNLAILGTGAVFANYDGSNISSISSGLGIVLGDEGSGAYAGKMLIQDYLNDKLEPSLKRLFEDEFNLTREEIIKTVYTRSGISKWFGEFTFFIKEHIDKPYFKELVIKNTNLFFDQVLSSIDFSKPLFVVGGFGNAFKDLVSEVANKRGVKEVQFVPEIFDGLISYHNL